MILFETEQTNDLLFTENLLWSFIEEAVATATKPMHQPVIASVHEGIAVMRMVVLRRVDRQERKIYFHTDHRSQKINDILRGGQLSWLFYDQAYRSQIRMSGPTIVHHKDALAQEHWNKTAHYSRKCYLQSEAPGTVLPEGIHLNKRNPKYTMAESEVGFENFTVVETTVDWMEWYYTHSTGNRRAVFQYGTKGMEAKWIAS